MTATHPEYMGVWCPTCQQDCIPMRNGRCGFCETLVVNDDIPGGSNSLHVEVGGEPDTIEAQVAEGRIHPGYLAPPPERATPMPTCKIEGCETPAADTRGPYARLCPTHKQDKIAQTVAASKAARESLRETAAPPPAATNGHTTLTLTELAQAVDQAAADLAHAQQTHAAALATLRQAVEAA